MSREVENQPGLLCFEAAHDECHRAVIVDALEDRLSDLDVVHLQ